MRQILLFSALASVLGSLDSSLAAPPMLELRAGDDVRVLIDGETAVTAAALLERVLPELAGVLDVATVASYEEAKVEVRMFLSRDFRTSTGASAEQCEHSRMASGASSVVCGGMLGLAYALHDLRETLALNRGPSAAAAAAAWVTAPRVPPAYGVRAWSEEAQLLGLPDRGYYTSDGSMANVSVIAAEAAALEAELVPALLRLRMNSVIILHSDIEDYITYDTLPRFLPGAPPVYAADDAHRTRRAGVLSVMSPWIAHMRDAYGLALYIKVYEFSSPPGLCTPNATTPARYNCTLESSATAALVKTKYAELASALPALAGVIITVEDSWSPRAGYVFNVLWSGAAQLPKVVTLFHEAIVGVAGLQMYFRLWLFGEPVNWPVLRDGSPPDVRFSVKQTQGDFLLDFPINELLVCDAKHNCPPADRRIVVEVDAFRQYNGWGAGVAWMGSQWAPRLATALATANGTAMDIWGWGSWAPGCTWPDSGATLVNGTDGEYKSWRGWWNAWRLFNGTAANGGFSLSGQANAYLLYRLSWDALPANATAIALDFGTLFYGAGNAEAVAALLAASFRAWLPTSSPSALGDFTLFWTHMQHDTGTFSGLAKKFKASDFDTPAAESAAAVADMEAALAKIDPALVPPAYAAAAAGAVSAVSVSRRYLAAYFAWRSTGLVIAQLGAAPSSAACADARTRITTLAAAIADFDMAHPIASMTWVVGTLDPALYSHPPFLSSSQRTMAGFVGAWTSQIDGVCKAQ